MHKVINSLNFSKCIISFRAKRVIFIFKLLITFAHYRAKNPNYNLSGIFSQFWRENSNSSIGSLRSQCCKMRRFKLFLNAVKIAISFNTKRSERGPKCRGSKKKIETWIFFQSYQNFGVKTRMRKQVLLQAASRAPVQNFNETILDDFHPL